MTWPNGVEYYCRGFAGDASIGQQPYTVFVAHDLIADWYIGMHLDNKFCERLTSDDVVWIANLISRKVVSHREEAA